MLEQSILSRIEAYRPLYKGESMEQDIAYDIEEISDAIVRQHLRILLARSISK